MNIQQRILLAICLIGLTLSALFPPWLCTINLGPDNELRKHPPRNFLLTPPPPEAKNWNWVVAIDYKRIMFEWSFILMLSVGLWMVAKPANRPALKQGDKAG